MQLSTTSILETQAITDLDSLLQRLSEEIFINQSLINALYNPANKLKVIVENIEKLLPDPSISVESSLDKLYESVDIQARNNYKLEKIIQHLNQII